MIDIHIDVLLFLHEKEDVNPKKADEILCNRAMNGIEEGGEERGEIVKKSRKFNDRALLDYLKANHPKYKKDAPEEEMPTVEIKRFEIPTK